MPLTPAHRLISILVVGAALVVAPAQASSTTFACRVVGVSDGDTLSCLTDAKAQVKVRLAQIDAPEKAQPFGARAKRALSDLVFGRDILLEKETIDRYGRTVATVIGDGRDVNLTMVRAGMAWVYDQYARDTAYFAAQEEARRSRTGLWADPRPVRPSEWRRGRAGQVGKSASGAAIRESALASAVAGAPRCGSKRTCKEMASCVEAQHYLNACGLSRLDRDGDGVPCEALCP